MTFGSEMNMKRRLNAENALWRSQKLKEYCTGDLALDSILKEMVHALGWTGGSNGFKTARKWQDIKEGMRHTGRSFAKIGSMS